MIVTDLQPISLVEDTGFRKLLAVLDPKYTPPSRCTIMREHLPRLYERKRKELMEILLKVKWCSITTDLWTARTTMGYLTVTCHFITPDWHIESAILETLNISESHTSLNLASELKKVTNEWEITTKIHCAITDGASNIKGAIKENHWNNLVCFAHTLNLVVSCAIEQDLQSKEVITKIKHIVSFFHKSTLASDKLRELQNTLGLPEHKLIQQVETRWNSSFYMMERYIEQNEAVHTALCLQDRNDLVLSSDKNPFIEKMIEVLRPFESVTTELSSEKYVSASKIIPIARGLQKVITSLSAGICTGLCEKLISQMATRFRNLEEKGFIAIATLLDPRFKKIPFLNQSSVQQMTRMIVSDASTLAEPHDPAEQHQSTTDANSNKAVNSVWEVFEQQVAASTSNRSTGISAFTQLDQYFKAPIIDRKNDPLQWWRDNSHVYPAIANVAKVYLSTVATSVPSERIFSKAGELISAKHNRVKPKNVNTLLFLNKC